MSGSVVFKIGTVFEVRVRTQSLCVPDDNENASLLVNNASASSTSASPSSTVVAGIGTASTSTASASASLTSTLINNNHNNFIQQQTWTTKEAGACVLTALLLKLEPVN